MTTNNCSVDTDYTILIRNVFIDRHIYIYDIYNTSKNWLKLIYTFQVCIWNNKISIKLKSRILILNLYKILGEFEQKYIFIVDIRYPQRKPFIFICIHHLKGDYYYPFSGR